MNVKINVEMILKKGIIVKKGIFKGKNDRSFIVSR